MSESKKIEPTDAMVDEALLQRAWKTPTTPRAILRIALNHPDAAGLFADEDALRAAREQGWDEALYWIRRDQGGPSGRIISAREANPYRTPPPTTDPHTEDKTMNEKIEPSKEMVKSAHAAALGRSMGDPKTYELILRAALNHPDAAELFAVEDDTDPNIQIIENATLDDIQAGDHVIHLEVLNYSGITVTGRREGIAHHLDKDGDWCTEEGEWIICETDEDDVITIRRAINTLPTKDGSVIVHHEHEAIRAKDNTGHLNDFHRLTFDEDTQTWYGMDLAGNLRWTTADDIAPNTWKVEEK